MGQTRRTGPLHSKAYGELRSTLRTIRREAGLTMEALAATFGRPHTFVSKVEAGERRIDPIEFCRWCDACNRKPQEVIKDVAKAAKRLRYL
ncbi:MAG: helix-turn-helix domain-containing protein [Phycisphaerales bacterium]|nr:helix-turn-helix domain-containing protein [Phycisphaerales bacterium]